MVTVEELKTCMDAIDNMSFDRFMTNMSVGESSRVGRVFLSSETCSGAISKAFRWETTPKGTTYWVCIHTSLLGLERRQRIEYE